MILEYWFFYKNKVTMIIILFIIILAILILVHEFGHFIVAKKTGMRVDEFGIGFPPKIFSVKKGETEYSINLIPLGGFVKIFGEDPDDESISGSDSHRSMVNKPRYIQAMAIGAGVTFNVIFAWLLISIGFMVGLPVSTDQFPQEEIKNPNIVIINVLEESPAFEAGLSVGDKLLSMQSGENYIKDFSENEMQAFIVSHGGQEIDVQWQRGEGEIVTTSIVPTYDLQTDQAAIGILADTIGTVKLLPHKAIWEALILTGSLFVAIAIGLTMFVISLIEGSGSLVQLTGPVGIVGMVGNAAEFGWIYLLNFTAFISINLAVINLIPFPALDGGRLVVLGIEGLIRRNIKPIIVNSLNLVGFVLLIALMVAVTYNDIVKLF